jgi:NTP pyrophosphatase (non-canonical NTP hydrolase)
MRSKIFEEISAERKRQDDKWGIQDHSPLVWVGVITEEVGEVAKAVIDSYIPEMKQICQAELLINGYRRELIQVAAVAVSMIECLERGKW